MNIDEMLNKEAFRALDMSQKEVLTTVISKIRGRSVVEAMPVIMQHMPALTNGRQITGAQRGAMLAAMMESLSPEDQSKFKTIIKMFENR